MTYLLDANVLVALTDPEHVHNEAAHRWRTDQMGGSFATCPITQGSLVRLALHRGRTAADARGLLRDLVALDGHEFWTDDISYLDVDLTGVVGHRQVTDAYLAALARARGGTLATFDTGLAALHPDAVELIAR